MRREIDLADLIDAQWEREQRAIRVRKASRSQAPKSSAWPNHLSHRPQDLNEDRPRHYPSTVRSNFYDCPDCPRIPDGQRVKPS